MLRLARQVWRTPRTVMNVAQRMVHINGNQVRIGMALDLDGRLFRVTKTQHVKPGKGGAYMQCDLKDIQTGTKTSRRFRAAESVAKAALGAETPYQFLYRDDDKLVLMHNTTFEQMEISKNVIPALQLQFLVEGMTLSVQMVDSVVLWATIPKYVTLRVTEVSGTGSESINEAHLENNARVKVPLFVKAGDIIRVATEDGAFVERTTE